MKTKQIFVVLTLSAVLISACSGLSSPPDLNGTSWILSQLQRSPVPSQPAPTLIFADGQVSGNASCNSFGGSYQHGGSDGLKFGRLVSTLMACADVSIMKQESDYLSALSSVVSYRMEEKKLTLYDAKGTSVAEFIPKP